jgi:hypothetical protein
VRRLVGLWSILLIEGKGDRSSAGGGTADDDEEEEDRLLVWKGGSVGVEVVSSEAKRYR